MTFYEELTGPMTLHSVMQGSVGMGLRSRYKPQQEIPHGLLVLLMQINDDKGELSKLSGNIALRRLLQRSRGPSPFAFGIRGNRRTESTRAAAQAPGL
jgi:hypothetical protein